ncbi:Type IIA topoisomerase (DNA gyrase/topo II, topoisomerase IV), A subunit [Hahella chejuensis KCTC 2396]|uniref:Type IIA topoisomerase (DNA gyrase/topo II, topoisomerase IV), A subunit n=1 Tax=Hahella chejuensis (strain KCTC 2396) TaxID=349521 RepID=Q2S8C6_HAHCH|nr:helix-turn-helix domain-containing protein [Hahella chejuensis]ABC33098.1 Type IIA topoisomerase (DNA gyrase/topo II, topoisomerase IV), A subunit [Hahella chejuensis KCTC 2396]
MASNVVQLPTAQDVEEAKRSSRALAKYASADRVQLSIKGSNNEKDEIVLPGPVVQLLLNILAEMSRGNAISIMPIHAELTTQEAATFLNVSRPFFVKLLENHQLPFRKVGSHRRVLAKDVMDYKSSIDKQRCDSLDELAAVSQKLGMGYDLDSE